MLGLEALNTEKNPVRYKIVTSILAYFLPFTYVFAFTVFTWKCLEALL